MRRAIHAVLVVLAACHKEPRPPTLDAAPPSAVVPAQRKEQAQCGAVLRASALVSRKRAAEAWVIVTLALVDPPADAGGPNGELAFACDACDATPPKMRTGAIQPAPPDHAAIAMQFVLAHADPLPTHGVVSWTDESGAVSRCEVPLGLMVENAPLLGDPAPLRPFARPTAPPPTTLAVQLAAAESNQGMMGPTLRVRARVENTGSEPVQVDRAHFRAVSGGMTWRPVDNDTGRPMTAWVSAMFYCVRDLPGDAAFPDNVVLRPHERAEGILCWTGATLPAKGTPATVTYARPAIFETKITPQEAFLGVFLPP